MQPDWGSNIIQFGAVLLALASAAKFFQWAWRRTMSLLGLGRNIAKIAEELQPNGGTSLRDSVDRIETDVRLTRHLVTAGQDGNDHAIVQTDSAGLVVRANKTYLRWSGRSLDEVVGNGWINSIALDDRNRILKAWREMVELETDCELFFELYSTDGDSWLVMADYQVMKDERGLVGWLGTIRRKQNLNGGRDG